MTVLHTTAGDLQLEDVELAVGDRTWTIGHTNAVISRDAEQEFLRSDDARRQPYGIVLWPAAIALAHEVASRELAGATVLELGAGTGLPGIVAAAAGARVVQTDRQKVVLHVCELNAKRNGVTVEHRLADWTAWDDDARYDVILGSDILYSPPLHAALRDIFETNLAPGGSIILSDPLRADSMKLLEAMEAAGWTVKMDIWSVEPRKIGVFTLRR